MIQIESLFKRQFNRDIAAFQRYFMLSIPLKTIVSEPQWYPLVEQYRRFIRDIDDIPHICAHIHANCDHFVTINRRLTQMEIKTLVDFRTPKEFVEKMGLRSLDTVQGM